MKNFYNIATVFMDKNDEQKYQRVLFAVQALTGLILGGTILMIILYFIS